MGRSQRLHMEQKSLPRVAIGLPVYNGENFLAEALDSLQSQTLTDFELIIVDNGSTDRTAEICRAYVRRDARIRYHRSEVNRGAAWSHNRVVELSNAGYFKWMAHDDMIEPDFLEKSVAILDRDPGVSLCCARVKIVDEEGRFLGNDPSNMQTYADQPCVRFRELLLTYHLCFDVFGVMRTETLRHLPPMGSYGHADGVFLERLALRGRFHLLPERLFLFRRHSLQSMYIFGVYQPGDNDYYGYAAWFDPQKAGQIIFPTWRMLWEHLYSVRKAPIDWRNKAISYACVGRWLISRRKQLIVDLRTALEKVSYRLISRVKDGRLDAQRAL